MLNRIVRFSKHGGPEVLEIVNESINEPQKDEVRIKIKAIGLNQAEAMLREGRYVASPNFPSRIGIEASGFIDAIGSNVFNYRYDNELGSPTTIEGTNNTYWVSYYSDVDITLISLKKTDIILNSSEGKSPYLSID